MLLAAFRPEPGARRFRPSRSFNISGTGMPHPHGPSCRCPPLPHDAGLLAYTVDCDHHDALAALLASLADKPGRGAARSRKVDGRSAFNG